jgi:hypothetical protein
MHVCLRLRRVVLQHAHAITSSFISRFLLLIYFECSTGTEQHDISELFASDFDELFYIISSHVCLFVYYSSNFEQARSSMTSVNCSLPTSTSCFTTRSCETCRCAQSNTRCNRRARTACKLCERVCIYLCVYLCVCVCVCMFLRVCRGVQSNTRCSRRARTVCKTTMRFIHICLLFMCKRCHTTTALTHSRGSHSQLASIQ